MNELVSVYSAAVGLLAKARKEEMKLSLEERERRKQEREAARLERVRQAQIIQSICPSCEGKLIRGKKDKRNDYKRSWRCGSCGEVHSI